ncbi:MAG: hypothetical protein B6D61_00550 [Bacteroidetes bacterium 4484_249]|nr:MAG: hypothetical protein B6D61_00550 [Bacteroidetes bacterium 4484_249]RLD74502.1 MAG: hypothetical protein DRI87_00830 [Bacteroidota bacterium]
MKQAILNNLKNIYGWKTRRKIVVFSVDDYGNVRVDSTKARAAMNLAGLSIHSRFDAYDTLETKEDLEILYDTLTSVKDKNGRPAVFTPFAVPCNIDFERLAEERYQQYRCEMLPVTHEKLSCLQPQAYEGTWKLWQEGITKRLMVPQFHGREHLNLKVFEEKLKKKDHEMLTALKNRSYTSISSTGYSTISYTAAFDFFNFEENYGFEPIIKEGLDAFKKTFGYPAIYFNAPGNQEHQIIHTFLKDAGIKYLDTPIIKKEHQGKGKFIKTINYTGKKGKTGITQLVRNVVFEPAHDRGFDWVNYTIKQIEAAFRWHCPAIISSHRVNFCGHIDPKNREKGINALRKLLKKITEKWPDAEFMAANKLGEMILKSNYYPDI